MLYLLRIAISAAVVATCVLLRNSNKTVHKAPSPRPSPRGRGSFVRVPNCIVGKKPPNLRRISCQSRTFADCRRCFVRWQRLCIFSGCGPYFRQTATRHASCRSFVFEWRICCRPPNISRRHKRRVYRRLAFADGSLASGHRRTVLGAIVKEIQPEKYDVGNGINRRLVGGRCSRDKIIPSRHLRYPCADLGPRIGTDGICIREIRVISRE